MSSFQSLRQFISKRLTAAAEEIFTEFEKAVIQYEEEINRHRRLLDITWKPEIKLTRIDLVEPHVCKEGKVLSDQQVCNQERSSGLDRERGSGPDREEPELPQMKEEQEELCSTQEGEQLILKQETETFMLTPTYQESDFSEPEPKPEQFYPHTSPLTGNPNQEQRKNLDSGSSPDAEMNPTRRHLRNRPANKNVVQSPVSQSQFKTQPGKKSFRCDICGKDFRSKAHREQHLRIHTGVRPYGCKTCGKSFTQKGHLLAHMTIHTGEKPFSCRTCGQNFRLRSTLSNHMMIHTGEKPFSCRTCGKNFLRRGTLLTHMRVHSGERPFSCGICGKDFTRNSHLKHHMSMHDGLWLHSCEICRKRFRNTSHLSEHTRTCTGKSIFSM